jgi:hypothetical protein
MKQIKKLRQDMDERDISLPVKKNKKKIKKAASRFIDEDDFTKYKGKALRSLLEEEE